MILKILTKQKAKTMMLPPKVPCAYIMQFEWVICTIKIDQGAQKVKIMVKVFYFI